MSPRISVVIPTRNRRKVLLETLGSLAEQSAPPGSYEVIVISDGSTDGTCEAVRELAAGPPWTAGVELRCLEQEWSGASAARNFGLREAAGELVLLLDDDMTAGNELVQAHLEGHAGAPSRRVVLGNIVPQEQMGELHRQIR